MSTWTDAGGQLPPTTTDGPGPNRCTGTASSPTAPRGKVCIYVLGSDNAVNLSGYAIAVGTGGLSGGIHTLQEWYDPSGRNAALRRIVLTILDTANLAAQLP